MEISERVKKKIKRVASVGNALGIRLYKEYIKYIILNPAIKRFITNRFHELYHYSSESTWLDTFWLNAPAQKCPFDMWVYQEIIFEIKPDLIIETGTASGGSALFLASMCDLINKGRVITVDVKSNANRPRHPRIKYMLGSSTSKEIVGEISAAAAGSEKTLIMLDSDHVKEHVLNELRFYNKFVTKGSYIIVEDTNIHGHPVLPDFQEGPMEAVREFLKENKDFVIDKAREKHYLTFCPNGYLKKIN